MAIFQSATPGDTGYYPQRRGKFRILPIVIFMVVAAGLYFGNQESVPITGRSHMVTVSREQELALGLQAYQEVLSTSSIERSGPNANRVRDVGTRIARVSDSKDFEWEFNLIQSQEVNAFCLPGGKVAVFSGILPVAQNDDGLAVVMGHEIAHAIARHGAERMAHEQLAQLGLLAVGAASSDMDDQQRRGIMTAFGMGARYGVMLPFSRSHESEADRMGLILMARACFDPREAPAFWKRMTEQRRSGTPPEFLSTHPADDRRIAELNDHMEEALKVRAEYCSGATN